MSSSPAHPEPPEEAADPQLGGARGDEAACDDAGDRLEGPAEQQAPASQVDWAALPDPVKERVAELTASSLGRLPAADLPRQLRPVARFAPAKRARLGGAAMLTALRDSARFRTVVLEWLRTHRHDALDPNADDPVAAAAAAVFLGEADAASRVRLIAKHTEESTLRAERDAALAKVRKLETELEQARAELSEARTGIERARGEREEELERLRGRLREQGRVLREAKDAAEEARADAERARAEGGTDLEAVKAQLERERQRAVSERARAEKALAEAETARQSARDARDADEVRLGLLLDTLGGAVDGLRRELSVGDTRRRPADSVRGANAGVRGGGHVDEPSALERLLCLPNVHLIVDGYNVTKTGYPDLALSEQRDRLAGQLSALSARTGAEVTVVFDGAGVTSVPVAGPRGVRVLFSDPGVLADDVIKSMVASEPMGRPLVVVTSDREIETAVRGCGAHVTPSAVFLSRLGKA